MNSLASRVGSKWPHTRIDCGEGLCPACCPFDPPCCLWSWGDDAYPEACGPALATSGQGSKSLHFKKVAALPLDALNRTDGPGIILLVPVGRFCSQSD